MVPCIPNIVLDSRSILIRKDPGAPAFSSGQWAKTEQISG
jgi:hypothetical protein